MLPAELVEFLTGPYAMALGSRDDTLRATTTYAFGGTVDPEAGEMTVFVPDALLGRAIENFQANGQVALLMGTSVAHDARQVKGAFLGTRPTTDEERNLETVHRARMIANFRDLMGDLAAPYWDRFPLTPSTAVSFRIEQAFDQTPGPGAGRMVWSAE